EDEGGEKTSSYQVAQEYAIQEDEQVDVHASRETPPREEAAVKSVRPAAPAPTPAAPAASVRTDDTGEGGMFRKLSRKLASFFAGDASEEDGQKTGQEKSQSASGNRQQGRQDRRKTRVARDNRGS